MVGVEDVALEDNDTTAGDRAHGQFLLAWNAEFSHDKNIEEQAQLTSDFESNGNSAARQSQHDGVFRTKLFVKLVANRLR